MAANPSLLSMPIAENGTKNMIPETQATPGNGLMSQSTGFPAECSLPLGAGGVAPDRADFNGAFNLLGGVAFYAQKGFTFNYDATQDYYEGCVVIDGGNRYLCIADMAAGTVAPSADTTHDYWIFYPVGVINKRDVITTSGTYTAPVTGWYKITVKGGGGGGAGGYYTTSPTITSYNGGGGGEGGKTIAYEYISAGDTATVVIGAGGTGGAINTDGSNGGDSTVTIGLNTYTGGGGKAGKGSYSASGGRVGGAGGDGTIKGSPGGNGIVTSSPNGGGEGGGNGGGASNTGGAISIVATDGGGGAGGPGWATSYPGGNGGDGYAWFEYFAGV